MEPGGLTFEAFVEAVDRLFNAPPPFTSVALHPGTPPEVIEEALRSAGPRHLVLYHPSLEPVVLKIAKRLWRRKRR